jgi:uncharacterized membrane protein YeiB
MTASFSVQFNPIMTALILYTFIMVERKQDFWAAFFIILGTLIKLYGIVGLVFFFFSRDRKIFISSLICWFVFLFLLPMVISSSSFIMHTYQEWANTLIYKNQLNINSGMQDVSVMGMIRRISGNYQISNSLIVFPALIFFSMPLWIYYPHYTSEFKLSVLASTLMFTVLYSTGSESPTYIIAMTGIAIWYAQRMKTPKSSEIFLLILALIITSFSPSALFPQWINVHFVRKYSLKALPVFLVWSKIIFDTIRLGYKTKEFRSMENKFIPALENN